MTLEPSPPPTEATPHEPLGETERKTLKPGKRYGLIALLCGVEVCIVLLSAILINVFALMGWLTESTILLERFWHACTTVLFLISPFCVIAGIVFGILAHNTEGRLYGHAGLVLSVLYGLLMSSVVVFSMLVPCC